jgi:hypothetical protein
VALVGTLGARALVILALATRDVIIVSRLVGGVLAGLLVFVDLGKYPLDLLNGSGALDLERKNTNKERGKGNIITEDSRPWATARTQAEADPSGCLGGQTRLSRRPWKRRKSNTSQDGGHRIRTL